jgi:hypothetical protein
MDEVNRDRLKERSQDYDHAAADYGEVIRLNLNYPFGTLLRGSVSGAYVKRTKLPQ